MVSAITQDGSQDLADALGGDGWDEEDLPVPAPKKKANEDGVPRPRPPAKPKQGAGEWG